MKARPGYGLILEEFGNIEGADKSHTWHVDPLDGTTNFLHGIPHFAISVGLEREGQIVAGVIYDPAKDELFVAERGKGAYLNNRRLRVSGRIDMADALVAYGSPSRSRRPSEAPAGGRRRDGRTGGARRFGSAALDLAYVACGRSTCYWERDLQTWDIAAGIIPGARGRRLRYQRRWRRRAAGSPFGRPRGNEILHGELVKLLRRANA